ncbi:unnamed protein product [Linum trigynum]|uniref:Reverse transcriptase RNase H-like domain-containing protein n=1 Tax=Linum trigynum TaxID=586398 RepID=A0AAV2CH71_9ROSI
MSKTDAKPRLIRWILHLQEFDVEIKYKKGAKNLAANHLSRLEGTRRTSSHNAINDNFPDERLFVIVVVESATPWFANFSSYLVGNQLPKGMNTNEKWKFFADLRYYFCDDPYLFRIGDDGIIRWCVPEDKMTAILSQFHEGPI